MCLQFGIKSTVLNAELPQNSRLHILEVCSGDGLGELDTMYFHFDAFLCFGSETTIICGMEIVII